MGSLCKLEKGPLSGGPHHPLSPLQDRARSEGQRALCAKKFLGPVLPSPGPQLGERAPAEPWPHSRALLATLVYYTTASPNTSALPPQVCMVHVRARSSIRDLGPQARRAASAIRERQSPPSGQERRKRERPCWAAEQADTQGQTHRGPGSFRLSLPLTLFLLRQECGHQQVRHHLDSH